MISYQLTNEFDLDKIANSGQCFNWKKVGDKTYRIICGDRCIECTQSESTVILSCSEDEFAEFWKQYFDFETCCPDCDPNDKFMTQAMQFGSGMRILRQPFFETLISYIISQRKSIPAIIKSIDKIREKYGTTLHTTGLSGQEISYQTFPSASVLSRLNPESLSDCGVGYRATYIIGASVWYEQFYKDREWGFARDLGSDYNKSMEILMELNGVGKKVANCVCLFAFHMLGACPIDTWIQKIIDDDYGGKIPAWFSSPFAGLYQQYAFYYKRLGETTQCIN